METTTVTIFQKDRDKIKSLQDKITKKRKSRPISTQEVVKTIFDLLTKHKMWSELE